MSVWTVLWGLLFCASVFFIYFFAHDKDTETNKIIPGLATDTDKKLLALSIVVLIISFIATLTTLVPD